MKRIVLTLALLLTFTNAHAQATDLDAITLMFRGGGTDATNNLILKLLTNSAGGKVWQLTADNGAPNEVMITDGNSPATLTWVPLSSILPTDVVVTDPTSTARNTVQGASGGVVGISIKANGSGTAHLLDFQNSSGTPIAWFDHSANLFAPIITAGTSGSIAGSLVLADAGSAYSTTISATPNQTANIFLFLPKTLGNPNDVVTTDGSGFWSYASVSSLISGFVKTAPSSSADNLIQATLTTVDPLIIKRYSTSTHNLLVTKDASGNALATIGYEGSFSTPGVVQATGFVYSDSLLIMSRPSLANNYYTGLLIRNPTASSLGTTTQYSPSIELDASAWNTTVTAHDSLEAIRITNVPADGATTYGQLKIDFGNNTRGWSNQANFKGTGNHTLGSTVSVSTGYRISGGATSGNYLRGDGNNFISSTIQAGDLPAGTGTVTSVAVSGGTTGLTTSGGPITTSGTITLAGTLAITNGGTGSAISSTTAGKFLIANSTSAYTEGTIAIAGNMSTSYNSSTNTFTLQNTDDGTVPYGGTGRSSLTAYSVLCGGTTTTNAVQSVASLGTSGQVLTSNGAGALPTWQAGGSSGTVTSVATDATLTGGPITTTGTLGIDLTHANTWTGAQTINKAGIATTSTLAVSAQNSTASTSGVKDQQSPAYEMEAHSWDGSADQKERVRMELQTANAATPASAVVFSLSRAAGSFNELGRIKSTGDISATTGFLIGNAAPTLNHILISDGTRYKDGTIDVSTVSGTLPVANGGTAYAGSGGSNNTIFRHTTGGTTGMGTIDLSTTGYFTNALSVSNGGTGLTTLTGAGRIPYATGGSSMSVLAPPSARSIMYYNTAGSAPAWSGGLYLESGLANLDFDGVNIKFVSGSGNTVDMIGAGASDATIGTATLSGGTVTVNTTAVTSNSIIFLTFASTSVNIGTLSIGTVTAGTSFVINSTNVLDADNVNWIIFQSH